MIEILEQPGKIRAALTSFRRSLIDAGSTPMNALVGYPGGHHESKIYVIDRLGFWLDPKDMGLGNRYWNGFGSKAPCPTSTIPIDVEINFPKSDINRSVAGAFAAEHRSGDLFVVHRGKIGGGRKGVSKTAFWQHFRGERIVVLDGGRETEVALVGALSSPRFTDHVGHFIAEVRRVKELVTRNPDLTDEDASPDGVDCPPDFHDEFAGVKEFDTASTITAQCDHGLVVNRLAELLASIGHRVGNDRHRDLFVLDPDGAVGVLLEIKTDTSLCSLYSAIGQLMLHGRSGKRARQLVAVLPDGFGAAICDRIAGLGVDALFYRWNAGGLEFVNLDGLLGKNPA